MTPLESWRFDLTMYIPVHQAEPVLGTLIALILLVLNYERVISIVVIGSPIAPSGYLIYLKESSAL